MDNSNQLHIDKSVFIPNRKENILNFYNLDPIVTGYFIDRRSGKELTALSFRLGKKIAGNREQSKRSQRSSLKISIHFIIK